MRLYDSLEMFDTGLSHVRKWMRCGQAIRQSTRLPLDTAYSLGDSLTFWAVPAGALMIVMSGTAGTTRCSRPSTSR